MNAIKFTGLGFVSFALTVAGLAASDPVPGQGQPSSITYVDSKETKANVDAGGAKFEFVDSSDPSVEAILKLGFDTIDQVGTLLVNEVTKELAEQDTASAVPVMHLKSLELPQPTPGKLRVTAIRRTSLMLRDPANAPDGADAAALNRIHEQLMADQSPDKVLVQKVEFPGKPVEWRVYRPIAASQSCLACHGDPATFRPGVKDALDRLYPEDKAIDYAKHEWRGILRVSIAPPESK